MNGVGRGILVFLMVAVVVLAGCGEVKRTAYNQRISEVQGVDGISVHVTYSGGVFWQATIANHSSEPVKLVWDESAYVNSAGSSSRLIRGKTRGLHSGQAQPPSPIPPGAALKEFFTAEVWAPYASSGVTPKPESPSAKGRIYLTFEKNGMKQGWEGEVRFITVQPS